MTRRPVVPAASGCHFTQKMGEHPADPRFTPCCSSHNHPLCCYHYRWSHFVETGCDCCPDGIKIRAEMAARKVATSQPADAEDEAARQHLAWIASAAIERWGMDPNPETLAAMRTAVSGLSPWLDEDVTP